MKKLYEFTIWKEDLVDDKQVSKDSSGNEVIVINKTKKYTPHKFFLKKATRLLYDDSELFYGVELSAAIREGLLTRAQLATKFADEIGTLSQNDKKRYLDLYSKLMSAETQYQTKSIKEEKNRNPEEVKELEKIINDITEWRKELQEIELGQQSLFDYTAEARARNKTILWWVFKLSYFDDGKPVFGDGDFKSQIAKYDEFEEAEDEFMISTARKLLYLVSFWFTGKAESAKEFDKLSNMIGINENPEEVNKKVEENKTNQPTNPAEPKPQEVVAVAEKGK